MYKIIILFILFISQNILGRTIDCPQNSLCDSHSLYIKKKWSNALKSKRFYKINNFSKRYGLPLSLWIEGAKYNYPSFHWSSTCVNHKNKTPLIYSSLSFLKTLNHLKKNHYVQTLIYLNKKNKEKIQSYLLPRHQFPLFIRKRLLYFTQEEEGLYYHFSIDKKGKIKSQKSASPPLFPQTINCSKELINSYKKMIKSKIYEGSYLCKNIWDEDIKRYREILMTKACDI